MSLHSSIGHPSEHRRGEAFVTDDILRAFLSDVLLRAMLDAKGTGSPPPTPADIARARNYIFDEPADPQVSAYIFSFRSLCGLLCLSPERVRASLRAAGTVDKVGFEFGPQMVRRPLGHIMEVKS